MISPSDANFESFAGAGRVKPIQIGFPVELTGVWNATTGYPWKRLMLSGVAVANASPLQMTGTNAVPIDGNTALTSGTKGWLEPDPGAVGYLFITGDTSDGGVTGSGTDNRVVRWNGTSAIQDSGVGLTDGDVMTFSYPPPGGGTTKQIVINPGSTGVGTDPPSLYFDNTGNTVELYPNKPIASGGNGVFNVVFGGGTESIFRLTGLAPPGGIYSTNDSGGVARDGASGTLAPGALFAGGICYDLGTGSFVTTSGANAFTNTNSFTSPGAGDVPLTVKAAAAQTADLIQVLDSGGLTVLARVEADGEIEAASGAARLNSVLNDGQLALYNSAGASYATLTAGASNVLTTSGGFTVTTGGLTVSAGGANITGTVTATEFSGSGASLTTLNASNLSSGTVAAARLPIGTSVQAWGADLDALEALSGTNTIYYRSGANTWSAVTVGTGLSFSSGTLSSSVSSGTVPNLLHNGGFDVWQRGTATTVSDDSYYADRWYTLSQTSTVNVTRQDGTLGARYALRFEQPNAAQRVGQASIAEASDSIPYRGRSVRFQFKAKASASTAIRFAILEWTGTADSVTSDVVNDWTSGTYTAGNFFLGSNLTVTAVGSGTATTSFASFSVTGTVSSSANNLIVLVWSEGTMATSATITITECGLYDGTTARDWLPWSFAEELGACQRQLWVMENRAVGIAQNTTQLYNRGAQTFPVTMRAAPSVSNATYTANAGSNGTPSVTTSVSGFSCTNSGSGWTTNALIDLAATFSAEL